MMSIKYKKLWEAFPYPQYDVTLPIATQYSMMNKNIDNREFSIYIMNRNPW